MYNIQQQFPWNGFVTGRTHENKPEIYLQWRQSAAKQGGTQKERRDEETGEARGNKQERGPRDSHLTPSHTPSVTRNTQQSSTMGYDAPWWDETEETGLRLCAQNSNFR